MNLAVIYSDHTVGQKLFSPPGTILITCAGLLRNLYARSLTRKPCCRKETARYRRYSFRFNVRRPNKLNQTKKLVFKSRFECESILSTSHVICRMPVSAEISWCSLWNRSMMLWSMHTENTRLFSRGNISVFQRHGHILSIR